MHPIANKAEIVDFLDKLYMGQFGRHSSFEAATEPDARSARNSAPIDAIHFQPLIAAIRELHAALERAAVKSTAD